MRLVLLFVLVCSTPVGALTISIDSVALGAGNTANSANNVSAVATGTASDSIPDITDGPEFAEVDARWAGSVFADDASASASADWTITFTVIADPGVVYNLLIQQELTGAFSFLDDSLGGATGSVGALTGTLGGLPNPLLAMPVGVDGSATSSATASVPFQRSRTLLLEPFVGTQTFTLAFTFGVDAASASDQIAVQLGLPGAITAAGYPGIGDRDASADGHRLRLQSRVLHAPIPEPGTLALFALGLAGLAARGRKVRCR